MWYKNPTCGTSITTPTGTFTYYKKEVLACEAKVECAKRGQILAPITNAYDRDALRSIAKLQDRSCKFHLGFRQYHIGLDIKKCGDKIIRLFTNNVVYNKTLHGDLYRWLGNKSEDVNIATYTPYYEKLFVIEDRGFKERFICLKPNTTNISTETFVENNRSINSSSYLINSTAEPIFGRDFGYNLRSNVLFVCFAVAFGGVMLIVSSKMKSNNKEMMKLKNENDSLKNEKSYYKEEYEKMLKRMST